jgi:hypothetical protein
LHLVGKDARPIVQCALLHVLTVRKLDLNVDSGTVFGARMNIQYRLFVIQVSGAKLWVEYSTEVIALPPQRFKAAFKNAIKIGSLPGLPNKALNAKSIFKSMSAM